MGQLIRSPEASIIWGPTMGLSSSQYFIGLDLKDSSQTSLCVKVKYSVSGNLVVRIWWINQQRLSKFPSSSPFHSIKEWERERQRERKGTLKDRSTGDSQSLHQVGLDTKCTMRNGAWRIRKQTLVQKGRSSKCTVVSDAWHWRIVLYSTWIVFSERNLLMHGILWLFAGPPERLFPVF